MTESQPRSTFLLTTLLPTLLIALGVGGLYAMYTRSAKAHIERPPELAPIVETVSVLAHQGGIDLQVDGVVVPYREIELSAEVAGRIVTKSEDCRAGQFVRKGTPLLEIDPRDYELELQRLAEQLKQADANLAECDVESANAGKLIVLTQEEHELQKKEMTRMQKLAGAISDSDIDKSKRAEWNSRHSLLTLENQLLLVASRRRSLENARELIRTQIKKAELELQRTKIVSPTDGIVVRDVVAQDSFVQKGALVAVVEDTTKVEVRCNLMMDDLVWLWRQAETSVDSGSPAKSSPDNLRPLDSGRSASETIVPDADSTIRVGSRSEDVPTASAVPVAASSRSTDWRLHYDLPRTPVTVVFRLHGNSTQFMWKGILTRFDGSGLDEKTRTVPSRVVVDDPRSVTVEGSSDASGPRTLVRGMYVSVAIHANPRTTFLRIPESAVHPGKNVLRVRDSKIDIVGPLQLIRLVDDVSNHGALGKYWIVHPQDTNLSVADKVIISPLPTAHTGMEVREHAGP